MFEYFFLFILPLTFPMFALLLAFTFLTPSWHWVAGFILVIAAGPALLWIQHWIAASAPGYKEGPGGGLGVIIIGAATWAFVLASVAWIASLAWWLNRG
jgi:hypothetical protein